MHLWQYYRDKPVVNDANGTIVSFSVYIVLRLNPN